jgi:hypothetical protein
MRFLPARKTARGIGWPDSWSKRKRNLRGNAARPLGLIRSGSKLAGARRLVLGAQLEVLHAVRRFGDKATMQRVVLEGFAERTSVLREKPEQEYGA